MYVYTRDSDGRDVAVHRKVWADANGPIPDGYDIDHINGNKRDNRLENLRLATRAQNMWNVKSKNKFGLKGLAWSPRRNQWTGEIRAGNTRATKSGKDLFEIAAWLITTREILHGEFAIHR